MSRRSKELLFQKKVKSLIAQADRLQGDAVKRTISLLNDARKEVISQVAATEWEMYHLPQRKAAIERALQEFASQYEIDLHDSQKELWAIGKDLVDAPIRQVGIGIAIPEIDVTALAILQDYSSDLVSGLTGDAIKKINQELTMGMMGAKQPHEVMKAVGMNLNDKSIFRSIAHRAETIVRTESGRVFEAANQARRESAAQVIPGLKKQWKHNHSAKMPRISHLAADGQIREIDEPFDVDGEQLMYPRDPAGSAANTINCNCYSIPYHENWEVAAENAA